MEVKMAENDILAVTDASFVRQSEVMNAIRIVKKEGIEQIDPLIITQASTQSELPVGPSSMDIIILICKLSEFPNDNLLKDILRALKPGGTILLNLTSQSNTIFEKKLLLAGFLDVKSSEIGQSIEHIIGKKPSWKTGSSFSLRKTTKTLPKLQIEDDMDLIDEESLLTEDDLKRPQAPVSDCEVGPTRKACKNCSCGRAEEEEKVKLGVTMDQLNNPQSACGNCGLGDAFRCGTCPYKGLPAFKLGEKIGFFLTFCQTLGVYMYL